MAPAARGDLAHVASGEPRRHVGVRRPGPRRYPVTTVDDQRQGEGPSAPIPIVIVSGLSGSGKTTAMKALEDCGYFCIDNLPPSLLPTLLTLCNESEQVDRVAVAVDIREGRFLETIGPAIETAGAAGHRIDVLFLDCRDEVLVRRFSEVRRRHPLLAPTVVESIELERSALSPVRSRASLELDTSSTSVHQLRRLIMDRFGEPSRTRRPAVNLLSFGFKHGLPIEADYVLDARFLPNPYFVEGLRHQTGQDPDVATFLRSVPETREFLERVQNLLDFAVPLHDNEGRSLVTVAVGCTGGRHRSVYLVGELAKHLAQSCEIHILHRDISRT